MSDTYTSELTSDLYYKLYIKFRVPVHSIFLCSWFYQSVENVADCLSSFFTAAMAGLGIGMLLLGAILTIAVGGILWIKRFDINIPYLTQNNE